MRHGSRYGLLYIVIVEWSGENVVPGARNKGKFAATHTGMTDLGSTSVCSIETRLNYCVLISRSFGPSRYNGMTALMYASFDGKLDTMKYLVEKNANVEFADIYGWTPLMNTALADSAESCR